MATAAVALGIARSRLNDVAATRWDDATLLPYLQQAHRELVVKLDLEGVPVINAVAVGLTIPANTTDMSTVIGYPTDLIKPEWMKEKQVGQQDRDYVNMVECSFIPQLQQTERLNYWAWIDEKIQLLGATAANVVLLRYWRSLPLPTGPSSDLGMLYAESYIGPRTAAMAGEAVGDITGFQNWSAEADANISDIVRMNVKGLQNLPARRQPYHRRRSWVRTIRGM